MDVESKRTIYVGEYEHSVDGKGRVTIPSKWRFRGDHLEEYLAMPNPDGCITLYPPRRIEYLDEQISEVGMAGEGYVDLQDLFRVSDSFSCDKQGRIILNDSLRAHAKIKKVALLKGDFNKFHIWGPEGWDPRPPPDLESLYKTLHDLRV
ncbi:MAG: mraZ [Opitutales bacterium]